MTVYQLAYEGEVLEGFQFKMYSKRLFHSKEQAKEYIPEWIEKICDQSKLFAFDQVDVDAIQFIELELGE